MKRHLFFILLLAGYASSVSAVNNEPDMIKKALSGDYQTQRNLAYSYSAGWGKSGDSDFIPQDPIRACAWRKVILLKNQKKADSTDYANESIDCNQIHPTENKDVWKVVWMIVNNLSR
ncbi:hypothetical protein CBW58_02055 [Yersinia frederiksenii]|nr:hypothetical protein CBW58_02055 [Yersinia frederiksenii]